MMATESMPSKKVAPIGFVDDIFENQGFVQGPLLATGKFGCYMLECMEPCDPTSDRAVKVFPRKPAGPKVRTLFLNEAMTLNRVDHTYIAMMNFAVACNDYFAICMEPLPGGSLESRLHNIELCDAEKYLCQVSSALGYLHNTMNMAHCNISLSSIFLDLQDNAILCNFENTIQFDSAGDSTGLVKHCTGSPVYHALEVRLNRDDEDFEVDLFKGDVYALGLISWAMIFKCKPTDELYNFQKDIKKANDKIPDSFRKWTALLLEPFPEQRINMDDFISLLKQESYQGYLTDDDDNNEEPEEI